MTDRRHFLRAAAATLASMTTARTARCAPADPTWLSYAIHAESFWKGLPFLDRLRKAAGEGIIHYEFARWKTKDVEAIAKLNEELGLQAVLFAGSSAVKVPGWKEGLLESIADAAELAPRLGATKLAVAPPERDEKLDREEQVEDLVDALKEAAEKVAESEATLILEPTLAAPGRPRPLVATPEEAAAVVKSVASPRVRFAFEIRPRRGDEADPIGPIGKFKDQAGHYRLADLGHPTGGVDYPRILRAIRDAGYVDPIGLHLADRGDPLRALADLRKADADAKAL